MSENEEEPKSGSRNLAADLRLRPERPPVTRLSRKALMGLAAVAAILISGALIWGLYQGQKKPAGGTEVYNTENKPTPDGLTALPRDYTGVTRSNLPPIAPGVPVLGPPLPGDLGRPIHNAQVPAPGSGEPAVDAEQQRVVQETEAARTSRLFATTNARERPATPTALPPTTPADQAAGPLTGRVEPPPYDPDSLLNMQDRKLAFLTAPSIARRSAPIGSSTRHRAMSSRPAPLFPRRSSPAFAPISPARSPLRSPSMSTTVPPATIFSFRKDRSSSASTTARSRSDRTACS